MWQQTIALRPCPSTPIGICRVFEELISYGLSEHASVEGTLWRYNCRGWRCRRRHEKIIILPFFLTPVPRLLCSCCCLFAIFEVHALSSHVNEICGSKFVNLRTRTSFHQIEVCRWLKVLPRRCWTCSRERHVAGNVHAPLTQISARAFHVTSAI